MRRALHPIAAPAFPAALHITLCACGRPTMGRATECACCAADLLRSIRRAGL